MNIPESFWMLFRLLEVNVMSEKREVILEAKHITRKFPASHGRTLLANDDINLKMYKGETLGLVGESGCGKSTFMRFLVSLDKPSRHRYYKVTWRGTSSESPEYTDGISGSYVII